MNEAERLEAIAVWAAWLERRGCIVANNELERRVVKDLLALLYRSGCEHMMPGGGVCSACIADMKAEGDELRREIERRTAPMKRGPFKPPEGP